MARAGALAVGRGRGRVGGSDAGAPPRNGKRGRAEALAAWGFIGPTLAGVLLFHIWPMLKTVYNSFTEWGAFGSSIEWVGSSQHIRAYSDPHLWRSIANTLGYTAIVLCAVPIAVVILIFVGAITAFQFRMQKRWVHYG